MTFFFPRRIARASYLGRTILVVVALGMLASSFDSQPSLLASCAALAVAAYWLFFVVRPRCRDLALSGWFILLIFVPGVDVLFCGYLTWGRTKVRVDWAAETSPPEARKDAHSPPPVLPVDPRHNAHGESLQRL